MGDKLRDAQVHEFGLKAEFLGVVIVIAIIGLLFALADGSF